MKILIVEDDAMLALSMDEWLTEVGHIVVGLARDPATAFRIAQQARPDLALVDLQLARAHWGQRWLATFEPLWVQRCLCPVARATARRSASTLAHWVACLSHSHRMS